jgi:hypothetical protein
MASCPRSCKSSQPPLWEPQSLHSCSLFCHKKRSTALQTGVGFETCPVTFLWDTQAQPSC